MDGAKPKRGKKSSTSAGKPGTASGCSIGVGVYSGLRELFPPGTEFRYLLTDGAQKVVEDTFKGPDCLFTGLPFHDNYVDNYTVVVSAAHHGTGGYQPVRVSPSTVPVVRLMLLPDQPTFDFAGAQRVALKQSCPRIWNVISGQAMNSPTPRAWEQSYDGLLASNPKAAACLLNILTAMDQINLGGNKTPLDFIRDIRWDAGADHKPPQQDRFYCWADRSLMDAIGEAGTLFAVEPKPSIFHGGTASRSWKESQFAEGNVQFTFHESVTHPANAQWIQLEPDIDYFKDPLAHFFGEVTVNWFGSMTEPAQVYKLRFNSGNIPGKPPFEPPYVIR